MFCSQQIVPLSFFLLVNSVQYHRVLQHRVRKPRGKNADLHIVCPCWRELRMETVFLLSTKHLHLAVMQGPHAPPVVKMSACPPQSCSVRAVLAAARGLTVHVVVGAGSTGTLCSSLLPLPFQWVTGLPQKCSLPSHITAVVQLSESSHTRLP